jgi:hypothetical protein
MVEYFNTTFAQEVAAQQLPGDAPVRDRSKRNLGATGWIFEQKLFGGHLARIAVPSKELRPGIYRVSTTSTRLALLMTIGRNRRTNSALVARRYCWLRPHT